MDVKILFQLDINNNNKIKNIKIIQKCQHKQWQQQLDHVHININLNKIVNNLLKV